MAAVRAPSPAARRHGFVLVELEACVADRAQASPGILFEAASQQTCQRRREIRGQRFPPRLVLQHARQRGRDVVAFEAYGRRSTSRTARTKRPDVRASIDRLAARLLRRHVRGGADDHPELRGRSGQRRRVHQIRRTADVRTQRFGQAEIEHLDRAVGLDLDVRPASDRDG